MKTIEAPVRVRCGGCGADFELSARNARVWRRRGQAPLCARCRRPPKPPAVTEADRRYWLDRFSLDEIREIAAGIWPDG